MLFETNVPGEVIVNTTRVIRLDPANAKELKMIKDLSKREDIFMNSI